MLKKSTSGESVLSNALPVLKIFKSSLHRSLRLADIEKNISLSHQAVFRKIKILEKNRILLKEGNYYKPDFENVLVHKIFGLISAQECEEFYKRHPRLKEPFSLLIKFALKNPQISCIILFGSYAAGKATKTSDIDILIVMEQISLNITKKLDGLLNQMEGGYFLNKYGFAPVYASKKDIKDMVSQRKKFIQSVIEQSIIIYGEEYYFREMPLMLKEWSICK